MRNFAAHDGRVWNARLDHTLARSAPASRGSGWEAVLFETIPPATQKVVFRPAGWLPRASLTDLNHALREAEAVRARWENRPLV
ncbi:MAG: hypothetical protein WEE89_12760 [Gemmatimonadota bacterium]